MSPDPRPPSSSITREVRLHSIGAVPDQGCVFVLEEVGGARLIPIFAGPAEGAALALELQGVKPSRPMTHDLLLGSIHALGGSVTRVVVTDLADSTFLAELHVRQAGQERVIDARPSDAINVAIRAGCPIHVADAVFEKCEPVHRPVSEKDVAAFKEKLATTSAADFFAALDATPGPIERSPPPTDEKES